MHMDIINIINILLTNDNNNEELTLKYRFVCSENTRNYPRFNLRSSKASFFCITTKTPTLSTTTQSHTYLHLEGNGTE